MPITFNVQNRKYYREFDNSDNPCCWQVDLVSEDVEAILDRLGISCDCVSEDWGTALSWRNSSAIEHSLMITCSDVDQAAFEITASAFKSRWLLRSVEVPESESDFAIVLPLVRQLESGAY